MIYVQNVGRVVQQRDVESCRKPPDFRIPSRHVRVSEQEKLIAAVAHGEPSQLPAGVTDLLGSVEEGGVSRFMAVVVVDGFHIVDIGKKKCDRLSIFPQFPEERDASRRGPRSRGGPPPACRRSY